MPTRSDRGTPRRKTADDAGVHVEFITTAELTKRGGIDVQTRGSSEVQRLKPLLGSAGRQLTHGLIERLHINGGTWTSATTLRNQHQSSRRFLSWLVNEHSIDDLTAAEFTPAIAWQGVLATSTNGSRQRNFRTFLGDTIPSIRDDFEPFRSVLFGRALPVEEYDVQGYAPEVADAIERVARKYVGRWFVRHRSAVQQALGGELPGNWLTLPATAMCEEGATCPSAFEARRHDLAAAITLLSLLDDKGPNLSVIQSHTSDSVEAAGEMAFVTSVKARNRRVLHTPAPRGGLFSYAGLLEFVTAATRVERHLRDDGSDFSRLLFVASDSQSVVTGADVRAWWRTTTNEWPDQDLPRPEGLSFPRLRKAALLRGKKHGGIVIGQSRSTARLYLADALPDVILIPGLVDAQNSVTEYWRSHMSLPNWDDADVAEPLVSSPAVMDVGVAVCSSNGQSPTDETKPCGLGPVACFVCPNGYRTPEVIPGLLAAVEFTDAIRKHEPNEWLSGEAPALNTLARKALDQFPAPVVGAASREDVNNARALIACVYMEGRRRD